MHCLHDFNPRQTAGQGTEFVRIRVVPYDLQPDCREIGRQPPECFDEQVGAFQVPRRANSQNERLGRAGTRGYS